MFEGGCAPQNRSVHPSTLCQRTMAPNIFGAGEHIDPPREDFSRRDEKEIVRHYPSMKLTLAATPYLRQ
jgi:hypothetical protein